MLERVETWNDSCCYVLKNFDLKCGSSFWDLTFKLARGVIQINQGHMWLRYSWKEGFAVVQKTSKRKELRCCIDHNVSRLPEKSLNLQQRSHYYVVFILVVKDSVVFHTLPTYPPAVKAFTYRGSKKMLRFQSHAISTTIDGNDCTMDTLFPTYADFNWQISKSNVAIVLSPENKVEIFLFWYKNKR